MSLYTYNRYVSKCYEHFKMRHRGMQWFSILNNESLLCNITHITIITKFKMIF